MWSDVRFPLWPAACIVRNPWSNSSFWKWAKDLHTASPVVGMFMNVRGIFSVGIEKRSLKVVNKVFFTSAIFTRFKLLVFLCHRNWTAELKEKFQSEKHSESWSCGVQVPCSRLHRTWTHTTKSCQSLRTGKILSTRYDKIPVIVSKYYFAMFKGLWGNNNF